VRNALLTVIALAPLLTACPTEEMDTPTSGPSEPAGGETGAPEAPKPAAPKPPAAGETGSDPAMSCAETLADVEAKLAACEAAK
jgi:hypothetical protein